MTRYQIPGVREGKNISAGIDGHDVLTWTRRRPYRLFPPLRCRAINTPVDVLMHGNGSSTACGATCHALRQTQECACFCSITQHIKKRERCSATQIVSFGHGLSDAPGVFSCRPTIFLYFRTRRIFVLTTQGNEVQEAAAHNALQGMLYNTILRACDYGRWLCVVVTTYSRSGSIRCGHPSRALASIIAIVV